MADGLDGALAIEPLRLSPDSRRRRPWTWKATVSAASPSTCRRKRARERRVRFQRLQARGPLRSRPGRLPGFARSARFAAGRMSTSGDPTPAQRFQYRRARVSPSRPASRPPPTARASTSRSRRRSKGMTESSRAARRRRRSGRDELRYIGRRRRRRVIHRSAGAGDRRTLEIRRRAFRRGSSAAATSQPESARRAAVLERHRTRHAEIHDLEIAMPVGEAADEERLGENLSVTGFADAGASNSALDFEDLSLTRRSRRPGRRALAGVAAARLRVSGEGWTRRRSVVLDDPHFGRSRRSVAGDPGGDRRRSWSAGHPKVDRAGPVEDAGPRSRLRGRGFGGDGRADRHISS